MNTSSFTFCGISFKALGSGALWWQDAEMLVVSDLHLGKSDRIARRGGALLPPYETLETLQRLARDIEDTAPKIVISLGDSFDDDRGVSTLEAPERAAIEGMTAACNWIWISGNHDPAPKGLGGQSADELAKDTVVFRHIASDETETLGEISGHFHPKLRLKTRAGTISRPVFIWDAKRLILPAYGAYTGGLDVTHTQISDLFDPLTAQAILTGPTPIYVPAYPAARTPQQRRSPAGQRPPHRRDNSG
jgi:DNA ligase-associated metallophosphoesterase